MTTSLPQVDFYLREDGEWSVKTTKDIFGGKRTVLFMLPGAFTPTCTEQQLPAFEAFYDSITEFGVEQVLCMAVNDAFVMNAWGESLGIKKVKLIPDGNGAFTQGIKAMAAKENVGMGVRAWRLAMVVNADGLVEWVGVEPGQRANASDDPYGETTPERVIGALTMIKANEAASAAADANIEAEALAAVGG